jgi:hypothetical protein
MCSSARATKCRQETWEDSPQGYPQTPPYKWNGLAIKRGACHFKSDLAGIDDPGRNACPIEGNP